MKPDRGVMILVFGILGLMVCQIFGVIAYFMGTADLKDMAEGRMDPAGKDMTNIGRILGLISIILLALALVITAVMIVITMLAAVAANA